MFNMQANFTLKLNHMLKKSLVIGFAMIGTVVLAFASSGGGGIRKKALHQQNKDLRLLNPHMASP